MTQQADQKNYSLFLGIIISLGCAHFINDILQSMLPAVYPLLSKNYHLSYLQIGIITTIFQLTGSVLQPLVGFYTDKKPLPFLLPFSALFTFLGIIFVAYASHYYGLLLGAALIGIGSSIFHPEASRITRLAAGKKYGFSQSIFQLGGNSGAAIGPLLAALFISYQERVIWLAPITIISAILLIKTAKWYHKYLKDSFLKKKNNLVTTIDKKRVFFTLSILILLMFTKYIYHSFIQNYYTFYSIEKFHISIHQSQLMLFLYLAGVAIGTIFGGPIGDKIGTRRVILISIFGIFPLTIFLPFADLYTSAVLNFVIGTILASAFPAIVVFSQELLPSKVGTITGFLFGLAFGIGSISASLLGWIGDIIGLQKLFIFCGFLPFLGLIAFLLPKLEKTE